MKFKESPEYANLLMASSMKDGLEDRIHEFYESCGCDDELAIMTVTEIHRHAGPAIAKSMFRSIPGGDWFSDMVDELCESIRDHVSREQVIAFLGIFGMYEYEELE